MSQQFEKFLRVGLMLLGILFHLDTLAQVASKNPNDYGVKELPPGMNPDRMGVMLDQLKESGTITEEQYKQAEKEIKAVTPEQWKQINNLSIQMNASQGSGQAVDLKQNRQAEQVQEQIKKILTGKGTSSSSSSSSSSATPSPTEMVRAPASVSPVVIPSQSSQNKSSEQTPEPPKDPNEIDPSIFSIIRRE